MLRIGTQKIAGLYAGAAEIKKALVGNSVVFEANPGGLPAGYSAVEYIQNGTSSTSRHLQAL